MNGRTSGEGRRNFLDWTLRGAFLAMLGFVVYPVIRFMSPPKTPEATTSRVEVGAANDPDFIEKGYKIVRFGAVPVIVVRAAEDDFRAFAATCTHLDCIVEYHKDKKAIWCNCHNGHYNLQGEVVAGPPPKPLQRYDVHVLRESPGRPGTLVVARS